MKRLILIFLLVLVGVSSGYAQSEKVQSLKKQQQKTLTEIKNTNQQLSKTQKSQLRALHKLETISTEIAQINDSIASLNREIAKISSREQALRREIATLEKSLEAKKKSYAKAIQAMPVSRDSRYDALMFVFSAGSLEQAYRRFRYLQEFSAWKKQEAKDIVAQRDELSRQHDTLLLLRNDRNRVLDQRTKVSQTLSRQKREQQTLVSGLKKKEKDLKQALAKQQQQANALARRIQEAIQEETRKATQSSTISGKTSSSAGYKMSQDEVALSRNFAQNRGKLPTPLSGRYRIISRFGTQQHPDLKYVKINNQGIDMQTTPGTNARAVFDGIVTAVFVVPGYNTTVIVRHGEYLTVYSNLCKIYVKKGDKVTTRQDIGLIYSDPEEDNRTVLHFQLRKNEVTLNPESWLKQ